MAEKLPAYATPDQIPLVVNNLTSDSTTDALSAAQGKALNSNLTATNDRTLTKRYYNAVTINTTNTTWSWGAGYIQLVGDLILYSSGMTIKTASNDWVRVATVESSYKPTHEVRTACVVEDGSGGSRVVKIDSNGNIDIFKPEVKTYWFTLVWMRNISN